MDEPPIESIWDVPTINYYLLPDEAMEQIEQEDPDEHRIWFAELVGQGYEMHSIDERLEDLFSAQGRPPNWMRVIYE